MLQDSPTLSPARGAPSGGGLWTRSLQLNPKLTQHLRKRVPHNDDSQRLLNGIGLQQDRGRLPRFLEMEGVDSA